MAPYNQKIPKGPFTTLVADPPWPFKDKLPGPGRGAAKHYDFRGGTEHVIVAKRGKLDYLRKDVPNVFFAPPNGPQREARNLLRDRREHVAGSTAGALRYERAAGLDLRRATEGERTMRELTFFVIGMCCSVTAGLTSAALHDAGASFGLAAAAGLGLGLTLVLLDIVAVLVVPRT